MLGMKKSLKLLLLIDKAVTQDFNLAAPLIITHLIMFNIILSIMELINLTISHNGKDNQDLWFITKQTLTLICTCHLNQDMTT